MEEKRCHIMKIIMLFKENRVIFVVGDSTPAASENPENASQTPKQIRAKEIMGRFFSPIDENRFEAGAKVVEPSAKTIEERGSYNLELDDLLPDAKSKGSKNESIEITNSLSIPGVNMKGFVQAALRALRDVPMTNLQVAYFSVPGAGKEVVGHLAVCYQAKVEPHYRVFYRDDRPYYGSAAERKAS